jgi:predicted deacetylase
MPGDAGNTLAVVLHDVAPQTWPVYEAFVGSLDAMGSIPLTLLVVPDYHHCGKLTSHRSFCAAIEARLSRGDEVAMHGYYHSDDLPLGVNPVEFFRRRIYTREGEFAALPCNEVQHRLERGLMMFSALGWPIAGFVAPAWLANQAARAALPGFPFLYTSSPAALIRLPQWRELPAPSLVWSSRSAWRRHLSHHWNKRRLRQSADRDLIRLGLHPIDMQHDEVRAFWLQTIHDLLPIRRGVTKRQWLEIAA